MMKWREFFQVVVMSGFLVVMAGCFERPTVLHQDFGRSFTSAKQNQILHPDGEISPDPVTGLDGKSAHNSLKRYRKFFEKPPFASSKTGSNTKK
ncbi:MAG: hypothetical protein VST66_02360 [Nitrospirota bacterium]|nr:hypothetical protein [Nitrospirota bacterium]